MAAASSGAVPMRRFVMSPQQARPPSHRTMHNGQPHAGGNVPKLFMSLPTSSVMGPGQSQFEREAKSG